MFNTKTGHPSEQDLWDKKNRSIARNLLITVLVLGGFIVGSATWILVSSVIPWLAGHLNDDYMDRVVKDTARQGLSRLILLASASLLLFCKINDAVSIAYNNLGERPSK